MRLLASGLFAVALAASVSFNTSAARAADTAGAENNYKSLCVKCHGTSGKGDGPAASTLETKPGDFTDCAKMGKLSDDTIFTIIKDGGASAGLNKAMAGFGEGMEDDEIKAMAAYIKTFCKK